MRVYCAIFFILGYCSFTNAFSKYGRTCKDIGCLGNEVCVMETDPCSYYQRDNECGSYPTCKKTGSNAKTCSTFICPPGNVCKMVGSNPKCVDDPIKKGHVGYDTSSIDNPLQTNGGSNAPSAPVAPSGNLYPSVPRGETTPRPNVRPQSSGSGYQGGQIGSGYPGQPSGGYPQQPQQGRYPTNGYPGYPQNNYPYQQGGGGYQQGGYQQQGYPGYPGYQQPQYPQYNQNQNRYGQKSSGSSISDQFSNTLKNIGTDLLKSALGKLISGATSGRN